ATNIDAPAFRVDEEVVDVAASLGIRDGFAVDHGEDGKLWRAAEDHENAVSIAIEGHGEIAALAQRPVGKLLSGFSIHHDDCMRAGEVDKDAVALRFELEAFGMSLERHILDLAAARWIDDGQSSVAVTN